jgi:quercetin dioxygenase-like cupin family protein
LLGVIAHSGNRVADRVAGPIVSCAGTERVTPIRERRPAATINGISQKGNHMPLTDPILTGPGAGRNRDYGNGSNLELKLCGEQSGEDWAVVENRVRAGDEPPIHLHTREDESVYVLEGAITAFVGDQQFEVEAGSYAALPNNVPHGFLVRGEEARLLQALHPAGAEYLFVPRDESDADPAKFGITLYERAVAA